MYEDSIDVMQFSEVCEKLLNSGISIVSESKSKDNYLGYSDNNIDDSIKIEKIEVRKNNACDDVELVHDTKSVSNTKAPSFNEKSTNQWIIEENITFDFIENIIISNNDRMSIVSRAFFLNILKLYFERDVKAKYGSLKDFAYKYFKYSYSTMCLYLNIAKRFIHLKESASSVVESLIDDKSYIILSDNMNIPFSITHLMALLTLTDEEISHVINSGVINAGMSTPEYRKQLSIFKGKEVKENNKITKSNRKSYDPYKLNIPILKKGSRGKIVKRLQQILILDKYDTGSDGESGIFNEETEKAIIAYQKNNGLIESGICDEETWRSLLL